MRPFPLTPPLPCHFHLVVAPKAAWQEMLYLTAKISLQGPLRIFDGGNRINVYIIAKHIRRLSPLVDEHLTNIHLARAFTCYQLVHLLCNAPIDQHPLLVLDLLASFYDENISLQEAQRLLERTLSEIERFRGKVPLVVSVRSTAPDYKRSILLEMLAARADEIINLNPEDVSPNAAPETQLTFPF